MKLPFSRRKFLQAAVLLPAWLQATCSAAFFGPGIGLIRRRHRPRRSTRSDGIIDTHTHFYDPTRPQGVPWPDKNDKLLYRRVLPQDYEVLPKPQPVAGTVVVEASAWVEDNQWILDLAAREPFIVGFVGHLYPGADGFRGHLKRFGSNRLFCGIRVGGDDLARGLRDPRFMTDMKALAARGLELDVNGPPATLPAVAQLARKIPELRIVINHVANVRIDGQAPPIEWAGGMREAARHRHVYCKVSGLVEGTGRTDGTAPREVDFYRHILDAIWNDFGEDRLVYGSNWPVSERFASLATVQSIVHDYFGAKGASALEKVFWRNSGVAYR